MITLKQIEALHWIAELGTFERAAARLSMTQSAISKRVLELEAASGASVFDRKQRSVRFTEHGAHILAIGRQMLELQERILNLKQDEDVSIRQLRFGVTELTALTWLPRLVNELRVAYPGVEMVPEVDLSRTLYERLLDEAFDIIVIPEVFPDPQVSTVRLEQTPNHWMTSPNLARPGRTLALSELNEFTLLSQGRNSGSGLYYERWLEQQEISFDRVLTSNSLVALVGLTLAAVGVSYLPSQCFKHLVEEGKLVVIPTAPTLPPVPYVAMYHSDRKGRFLATVARLMQRFCDFSHQHQH